jgi:hypothetical protein
VWTRGDSHEGDTDYETFSLTKSCGEPDICFPEHLDSCSRLDSGGFDSFFRFDTCILHEVPDEIANIRGEMVDLFGLTGQATATTRVYHRRR